MKCKICRRKLAERVTKGTIIECTLCKTINVADTTNEEFSERVRKEIFNDVNNYSI